LESDKINLQEKVIPAAKSWIENTVKVKRLQNIWSITFESGLCHEAEIPVEHNRGNEGIDADFAMYITAG